MTLQAGKGSLSQVNSGHASLDRGRKACEKQVVPALCFTAGGGAASRRTPVSADPARPAGPQGLPSAGCRAVSMQPGD